MVGENQQEELSLDKANCANCANCVELRIKDTEESDVTEKLFVAPLVQLETPEKPEPDPINGRSS